MANALVTLPGNNRAYAVYGTEAYYAGPDSRLRRFMYRVDGFVSVRADSGGEVITKPLVFDGDRLVINYAASAGGSVRVELQSAKGKPLSRHELSAAKSAQGDSIEHVVAWADTDGVAHLSGQVVRIRFVLNNADLYSFQFARPDQ
jgi:hypothetical protein